MADPTTRPQPVMMHIDLDAFFASVEQQLIPALRGRPVIVGSGCIASCSYEARAFGLHAGMSLRRAKQRCPHVVILPGNHNIYRCYTDRIWQICHRYCDGLETYLDEAYGDLTGLERILGSPSEIARKLQKTVRDETGLPATVGVASNRLVAKMVTKHHKPGGYGYVPPHQEADFIAGRPIEDLPGVGRVVGKTLADLNVTTVAHLRRIPCDILVAMFGQNGRILHDRCYGRDDRFFDPNRLPQSISRETTFHRDTADPVEIEAMLFYLTERAMRTLRRLGLLTKTVRVHIRYTDWKTEAASRSLGQPTDRDRVVFDLAAQLLANLHKRRVNLRHVGVALFNFSLQSQEQPGLFDHRKTIRDQSLQRALDAIRDKFGHAAIVMGPSVNLLGQLKQDDNGFVLRTPSLTK